jgi:DNA-binding transcriptional regulator YiaG
MEELCLIMTDTPLKQMRLELGLSQEGVARRTRSVSTGTVKNAESGRRIAYSNAIQILEVINNLLAEAGRPPVTLEGLGLNIY